MSAPMANYDTDLAIMVVDDAKLPCVTFHRALSAVGYHDIRICHGAEEALQQLAVRGADVVLADWHMPGMTGLQLTKRIRQLDDEQGRYTAVIVITAADREHAITEALACGADDFICKSPNNAELLARLANAGRISRLQNTILQTMRVFAKQNRELIDQSAFDPGTNAYVGQFFRGRLSRRLEYAVGRDGAVSVLLLQLEDAEALFQRLGAEAYEALMAGVCRRLEHCVRPIDEVGRVDRQTFGVLISYDAEGEYHASSFTRVLATLNFREFKTRRGFVTGQFALGLAFVDGSKWSRDKAPAAAAVLALAEKALAASKQSKIVESRQYTEQ